jgi:hypothetical protein
VQIGEVVERKAALAVMAFGARGEFRGELLRAAEEVPLIVREQGLHARDRRRASARRQRGPRVARDRAIMSTAAMTSTKSDPHEHGPGCDHDHEHDHQHQHVEPFRRTEAKIGRNDPCHCGSGKKFKKCHGMG